MQVAFYLGTRPGLAGLFNRLVRLKEGGPASHMEVVLEAHNGIGWCGSASFEDGGVRCKEIRLAPARWQVIDIGSALAPPAAVRDWFARHDGAPYDVLGLGGHLLFNFDGHPRAWTCVEACLAALGVAEPWRFGVNAARAMLTTLAKRAARASPLPTETTYRSVAGGTR